MGCEQLAVMNRHPSLALAGFCLALAGCGGNPSREAPSAVTGPIRIELDQKAPSRSYGILTRGQERKVFKVGFGRNGITCAGSRFEEGYTPLGRFRVNGIFSHDRFEMEPALVVQSGKSEAELRRTLFRNMNAIDFDGDGETREYGSGYVSLAPVGSVKQPFAFNGSNNDQRIGQKVTGGCVNVAEPALQALLSAVKLGDEVVISANGPCKP